MIGCLRPMNGRVASRAASWANGRLSDCAEYVGASPKWAIRRYRLHEAIEKRDRAELAAELGDSIRRT